MGPNYLFKKKDQIDVSSRECEWRQVPIKEKFLIGTFHIEDIILPGKYFSEFYYTLSHVPHKKAVLEPSSLWNFV